MLLLSRLALFLVRREYRYVVMLFLERRNARLRTKFGVQ